MDTNMQELGRRQRRSYGIEFKKELVQLCCQPGMSVAAVARRHGINHNIVHRWIREQEPSGAVTPPDAAQDPGFISVPLPVKATSVDAVIEVRVNRGGLILEIRWPVSAATSAGNWLQGLLG